HARSRDPRSALQRREDDRQGAAGRRRPRDRAGRPRGPARPRPLRGGERAARHEGGPGPGHGRRAGHAPGQGRADPGPGPVPGGGRQQHRRCAGPGVAGRRHRELHRQPLRTQRGQGGDGPRPRHRGGKLQAGTARRAMRRSRWIVAGVVVAAVAGAIAWWHFSGRESTDDAQIDGHIVPVSSRVGGTVEAVKVADNQFVDAGTVLVLIDARDYQVAVQRAQADLAEAEASAQAARTTVPVTSTTTASQVSSAESDIGTAQARLRSAQARLKEAQAKEKNAEQDLARIKTLHAKDEVSQQEFDNAALAAESARTAREAAQAAVKEAEGGVSAA